MFHHFKGTRGDIWEPLGGNSDTYRLGLSGNILILRILMQNKRSCIFKFSASVILRRVLQFRYRFV